MYCTLRIGPFPTEADGVVVEVKAPAWAVQLDTMALDKTV
jgi:hypothetical protein